jgi:hypothetical protein
VVLSGIVVDLVDRDGGVDHMWLNCLLLDNGLNGFVNIVMHALARNGWYVCCGVLNRCSDLLILVLSSISLQASLCVLCVAVVMCAVLDRNNVIMVLFR